MLGGELGYGGRDEVGVEDAETGHAESLVLCLFSGVVVLVFEWVGVETVFAG